MEMARESRTGSSGSARPPITTLHCVLMLWAATWAATGTDARADQQAAAASRQVIKKIVADYVGLYAQPSLGRWKTLFHESLVVAYPLEDGSVRSRGLEEF